METFFREGKGKLKKHKQDPKKKKVEIPSKNLFDGALGGYFFYRGKKGILKKHKQDPEKKGLEKNREGKIRI